jgi:hypothetical protein
VRLAALLVAAVLAVGVLWLAGEQHRENCIRSGQSSCSVLPWDNGERPSVEAPTRLSRQDCLLLQRAALLAGEELPDCR